MPHRLTTLVAMLVLVCVACAGSARSLGPGAPATLDGTAWTAVVVAGQPVAAASPPTAAFDAESIQGTNGCNGYGGPYRYAAGGIKVGEVVSTAMGCEDPIVAATEQRFMAALTVATTVSIDPEGRMILDGPGGSIVFEAAPSQAS